jgi:hypothetical protein
MCDNDDIDDNDDDDGNKRDRDAVEDLAILRPPHIVSQQLP